MAVSKSDFLLTENATKAGKVQIEDLGPLLNYSYANSPGRIDGGMLADDAHHFISNLLKFSEQFSGQWLLDPNEITGWSHTGPSDQFNAQDLGNVGAANLSRLMGGFVYPFDVKVNGLIAHTRNSNTSAQAWGWNIISMEKMENSNVVETNYIFDEVANNNGVGPRNYNNTVNQIQKITVPSPEIIPAGHVIAVAIAAPTANPTNYYAQVAAGALLMERVIPNI